MFCRQFYLSSFSFFSRYITRTILNDDEWPSPCGNDLLPASQLHTWITHRHTHAQINCAEATAAAAPDHLPLLTAKERLLQPLRTSPLFYCSLNSQCPCFCSSLRFAFERWKRIVAKRMKAVKCKEKDMRLDEASASEDFSS